MIKILVAEDEALSRMTLLKFLRESLGPDALIEGAANGQQAVELAARIQPQVIFMDIEMPIHNGIEAAEMILQEQPQVKIVFLTAFARFEYAVGAMRAGGTDYLVKPFEKQKINACLHKLLPQQTITAPQPPAEGSSFRARFDIWLDHHYAEDISLEQASESMGVSAFYFTRLCRATYNCTFLEHLIDYRVRRAAALLDSTDIPVRDIAPRVGYTDSNYFSKVFKRQTGQTPTEYRQSHAAAPESNR